MTGVTEPLEGSERVGGEVSVRDDPEDGKVDPFSRDRSGTTVEVVKMSVLSTP